MSVCVCGFPSVRVSVYMITKKKSTLEVIIFEHGYYISALEHIRMLQLSMSVNQIMLYQIY